MVEGQLCGHKKDGEMVIYRRMQQWEKTVVEENSERDQNTSRVVFLAFEIQTSSGGRTFCVYLLEK